MGEWKLEKWNLKALGVELLKGTVKQSYNVNWQSLENLTSFLTLREKKKTYVYFALKTWIHVGMEHRCGVFVWFLNEAVIKYSSPWTTDKSNSRNCSATHVSRGVFQNFWINYFHFYSMKKYNSLFRFQIAVYKYCQNFLHEEEFKVTLSSIALSKSKQPWLG